MKVARILGRNSVGIEIKESLIPVIRKKVGFEGQLSLDQQQDTLQIHHPRKNYPKRGHSVKVTARVTGIEYAPVLCPELPLFFIDQIEEAFSQESAFYYMASIRLRC